MWPMGLCISAFLVFIGLHVLHFLGETQVLALMRSFVIEGVPMSLVEGGR